MRRARLTVLLLLLCAGASAQNKFDIGANFMTRGELRNGGFAFVDEELEIPDDNFAGFILERTRLTLDYAGENLTANITGQHCGTWGSREGGNFMIYEAWVKFDSKNGFFTKIGRQNLSYDDQRIFGADDWSMTGMTHDVLKAGYEGHGHKVHVFGAYNQNLENIDGGTFFSGGLQPYNAMEALWYHFDFPSFPLGASLLLMPAGRGQTGRRNDVPRADLRNIPLLPAEELGARGRLLPRSRQGGAWTSHQRLDGQRQGNLEAFAVLPALRRV